MEARIAVGRLLNLAWSTDEAVTAALLKSNGILRLKVDDSGNATLSGAAGVVRFNGAPALESFSAVAGILSVTLAPAGDGKIRFSGGIRKGSAVVEISGVVDVTELITGCSGLLCDAARLLRGRSDVVDLHIKRALGE